MAYATALPYERPVKLSAWEIPFAVAGALVDCLTCGVRSSGASSTEETYLPAAVPPYPAPTYNAVRPYLPGDNVEMKAVFTDIPLREEAIRQGYIQPEEGESPYTTLYKPPLGPAVRLVPVEPAAARYPGSVNATAIQNGVGVARTPEAMQQMVVSTEAVARPSTTIWPTWIDGRLQPATVIVDNAVQNGSYETMRMSVQQQGGRTVEQFRLQREEDIMPAYPGLYAQPVIPGTYEMYSPRRLWATPATMQQRYVFAAPTAKVSQAVQTVFEEEVDRDAGVGKKESAPQGGNDVANSEKDTSHTDQALSEGGSSYSAASRERITREESTEMKRQSNQLKTGSLEVVEENQEGENGGESNKGNGGGQGSRATLGVSGEQTPLQKRPLFTGECITANAGVPLPRIFQQSQLKWASVADRGPIGFVPPIPPQHYKQIYVGGHPYLQGGVFYLSDTGAYLLGL